MENVATIYGHVIDEDGEPVASIPVSIHNHRAYLGLVLLVVDGKKISVSASELTKAIQNGINT